MQFLRSFDLSLRGSLVPLAGVGLLFLVLTGCGSPEAPFEGQAADERETAPPLVGVNWNGEPFRLADQEGKVAVVFFGYTFCPDVCPYGLVKMKQLYQRLGDDADQVAVVFVSVDPHRDTVDKLASYVPNFDPRFYGVRLEFDELDQVSEDWDLTVQYGQPKDGPGSDSFYYVDHTGSYFLIGRQGDLRVVHPPNATVDDIAPDVERLLNG